MSEPMTTNEAEQGVERPVWLQRWDRMTVAEIIHEYGYVRGDLTEQYARDQLTAIIEDRIAAAEQRGREDNADHGMCYVAGSEALAARERQAGAAVLREAADRLPALTEGEERAGTATWRPHDRDVYSLAVEESQAVLRARAERLEAGE